MEKIGEAKKNISDQEQIFVLLILGELQRELENPAGAEKSFQAARQRRSCFTYWKRPNFQLTCLGKAGPGCMLRSGPRKKQVNTIALFENLAFFLWNLNDNFERF
jgi:hypothetical protein